MPQYVVNKVQILTQLVVNKSKGTTSRNEVKTNARGTIFTDTGQHRDKNEDAGGIFIIKLINNF